MRHDAKWLKNELMMRRPLDSYGPEPEEEPALGPPQTGRTNWTQWIQIAITSALVVLFINQQSEFKALNRKIANLYERIDLIENSRMMDKTPVMEAQQRAIVQRLMQLESIVRELSVEQQAQSGSSSSPPAFQLPTPPPSRGMP
jgi:hypothetical protein